MKVYKVRHDTEKDSDISCPLESIMSVISKKWSLLIITTIGNKGKIRYGEIMKSLNGINSRILANRLKELERYGLIIREPYPEIPPRVEYSLTKEGVELCDAILPLMRWVYKYDSKNIKCQSSCKVYYEKSISD